MIGLLDRLWVRAHLARVARRLRRRLYGALSKTQQLRRRAVLGELRGYLRREPLPRNTYVRGRTPVFQDEHGRLCAVAHLINASGHSDIVARTRTKQNLARVRDMEGEDLLRWAGDHGLTVDELADIQPSYYAGLDHELGRIVLTYAAVSVAGFATAIVGIVRATRRSLVLAIAATLVGALPAAMATMAWISRMKGGGTRFTFYRSPTYVEPLLESLWAVTTVVIALWLHHLSRSPTPALRRAHDETGKIESLRVPI